MPQIEAGHPIPETTFRVFKGAAWTDLSTREVFAGKRVVLFGLPGAFTPTCSSVHVPRYNELALTFERLGIDAIVCVSVNDSFVVNAWKASEDAGQITFLPDGNGTFTEAIGMLVGMAESGLGKRSRRYSMVVKDGIVERVFVEGEGGGDHLSVSDADSMLRYLGGAPPPDILLFTKPGCPHCARAVALLEARGLPWAELPTSPRILHALPGARTTPQVFIDGKHVGGADELAAWLPHRDVSSSRA